MREIAGRVDLPDCQAWVMALEVVKGITGRNGAPLELPQPFSRSH